jgi:hypothetical protein
LGRYTWAEHITVSGLGAGVKVQATLAHVNPVVAGEHAQLEVGQ